MLSSFSSLIITFIMALAAMAFFTLLERKVIGYSQIRKGPNKVSISGIPQPLADALKLFSKENLKPSMANIYPFLISPMSGLFLALTLWLIFPSSHPSTFFSFGVLLFLSISSLAVYSTLGGGWTSNSKYALLGALRGVAQTISYEVSMALILMSPLVLLYCVNFQPMLTNFHPWILLIMFPIFLIWLTTSLAETNRTPFDFAEGESELVSGFNTEYSSGLFAMIFMAEYMNIIIMSLISTLLFSGSLLFPTLTPLSSTLKTMFIMLFFLWARSSYPRMRYDLLMNLTWKCFLPISLATIILVFSMTLLL